MIIAIDGPAAAGKGTLARRLATELGFALLDTGALYRATGLAVLASGNDPEDAAAATAAAQSLNPATFGDPALRTDEVAQAASKVSAIPQVRQALLDFQRHFAHNPPEGKPGAILDGRDIGTVVCPDAAVKLFVTASVEVRAERRLKELQQRGVLSIYSRVLHDMQERDARDASRAVAPMTAAADAVVIDTSDMDADQVFDRAMEEIAERRGSRT